MTIEAARPWRATASSAQCVSAVWPDGAVVFQPWDGKLLALSYAGAEVWRNLLEDGDASLEQLAVRLLGSREEGEMVQLDALLHQLASLNLVACADR